MATSVRDLMTTDPLVLDASETARTAAMRMRENDLGGVLVQEDGTLRGIVTDRDLVIRVIADDTDPDSVTIGEVCSGDLKTVTPDDTLGDAIKTMSQHAVRRIPVVEDGMAVGILSIGDLAVSRDPDSVLSDISAAPGNR